MNVLAKDRLVFEHLYALFIFHVHVFMSGVQQIGPVAEIEQQEDDWQKDQSCLVDDGDQLGPWVLIEQENRAELHELHEDEQDAGHHPHVQTRHVGNAGHGSMISVNPVKD